MTLYEKFCALNLDTTLIGLEQGDAEGGYFCTPMDARVIGWENSIHYCFIRGHRDMVFAVNPESGADRYVYPLAMNFKDFLRLVLACGSTTAPEQIIGWSRSQFESFLHSEDNAIRPAQQTVLDTLQAKLKLSPMEDPYGYVKTVQAQPLYPEIRCTNEYYDTLGLPRPDGSEADPVYMEFPPVEFRFEKKNTP